MQVDIVLIQKMKVFQSYKTQMKVAEVSVQTQKIFELAFIK